MRTLDRYTAVQRELAVASYHHGLQVVYYAVVDHPELVGVVRQDEDGGVTYVCGAVAVYSLLATLAKEPDHEAFWRDIGRLAAQVTLTLTKEGTLPAIPPRITRQIAALAQEIAVHEHQLKALQALWEWREDHPYAT